MPEVLTIIKFSDTLSNALVELKESKDAKGHIEYELSWIMPGEKFNEHVVARESDFDKIWKIYREKLDMVVDALEKWEGE